MLGQSWLSRERLDELNFSEDVRVVQICKSVEVMAFSKGRVVQARSGEVRVVQISSGFFRGGTPSVQIRSGEIRAVQIRSLLFR